MPAPTSTAPRSPGPTSRRPSSGDFTNTILAVSNRTYPATQSDGRVTGWLAPPGLASVTGVTIGSCSPPPGALLPVKVNTISCALEDTGARHRRHHAFTITILPVVQPGTGVVAAPTSGTADLQVAVTLNAASNQTTTVAWNTLRRWPAHPRCSACPQAPISDYTPSSGTVTFAPGQTTAIVHIPVNADSARGDEFVVVSFHTPTNAYLGGFYGLGFGIITPAS